MGVWKGGNSRGAWRVWNVDALYGIRSRLCDFGGMVWRIRREDDLAAAAGVRFRRGETYYTPPCRRLRPHLSLHFL